LASLVGVSRAIEGEHWASDIVLGALVGELSGRLAVRYADRQRLAVRVLPLERGGAVEVVFQW
ncbi:MAG: phosphoesterase, partial [bacterium]|nr:phosphoesterase [bacterium]